MPSQCLIRDVDPDGKMSVEDLRAALLPSYQEFRTAIMSGFDMDSGVEECLDIYEKWYLLKAIAGKPWSRRVGVSGDGPSGAVMMPISSRSPRKRR